MDRNDKPKLRPIIRRRRKSFFESLAEDESTPLDVISETDEIVFSTAPEEFVTDLYTQLLSSDAEQVETAMHTLIGLKLEQGRLL